MPILLEEVFSSIPVPRGKVEMIQKIFHITWIILGIVLIVAAFATVDLLAEYNSRAGIISEEFTQWLSEYNADEIRGWFEILGKAVNMDADDARAKILDLQMDIIELEKKVAEWKDILEPEIFIPAPYSEPFSGE